jgi:hypothetical protein
VTTCARSGCVGKCIGSLYRHTTKYGTKNGASDSHDRKSQGGSQYEVAEIYKTLILSQINLFPHISLASVFDIIKTDILPSIGKNREKAKEILFYSYSPRLHAVYFNYEGSK